MAQQDPDEASSRPEADDQQPLNTGPAKVTPDEHELDDEIYGTLDDTVYEGADEEGDGGEWFDEQGRRHVRRAAPEGTEEILEKEIARETGLPDRLERWRQRSATGAVFTAFAFGLQAALDTQREEPAIVMETSGDPPTELPVEAQLEQLGPRQSTVKVRTWLGKTTDEAGPTDEAPQAEGEAGQQ